jgi:thymidylate kinase
MLIVFDGVDGLGKTTLINNLSLYLKAHNYQSFLLKYPSLKLRKWLSYCLWFKPLSILLLYLDMWIDTQNFSIQHLYKNKDCYVLIDRYWMSTLCYQIGRHKPFWFTQLFTKLCKFTLYQPDIVIWLDANFELVVSRLNNRQSLTDNLDKIIETSNILLEAYNNYSFFMPSIKECHKINASQTEEIILEEVISIIDNYKTNF